MIAFNRGGDVFTANAHGENVTQVTHGGGLSGAKWSPDGKRLAYRDRAGIVYVRTLSTKKTVVVGTGVAPGTGGPVWSGDGTRVAWVADIPDPNNERCGNQGIYSAPAAGGAVPNLLWSSIVEDWEYCARSPRIQISSWSPDSSTILIVECGSGGGGSYCSLETIDVAKAEAQQRPAVSYLFGVGCDDEDLTCRWPKVGPGAYGPGGGGIVFSASGGDTEPVSSATTERIFTVDSAGQRAHVVSTATSGYNPTFSPNGKAVLFTQKSGSKKNVMRSGTKATDVARVLIKNASQADWQPVP